ncbi:MAG: DUF6531 domain-containing protein, partial [Beijerinckiaceae bacterium]
MRSFRHACLLTSLSFQYVAAKLTCFFAIVVLAAGLLTISRPAHAYYWQSTDGTICGDGVTCAMESFWSFPVNEGYHGPITCTEGFTALGVLSTTWCTPRGSATPGVAGLNCQGSEQQSASGCQIVRGKDPNWCVAHPVDPKAGVLSEEMVDYATQGPHPLSLRRKYWSDLYSMVAGHYSRLGGAWSTNFDAALAFVGDPTNDPSNIYAQLPDGRDLQFNSNNNGTYTNTASTKETISNADGGNWIISDLNSINYTFNSSGQLTQIQYRDGYTQTLTWSSGLNTEVTDSYRRSLSFTYNSTGLLTQVTTSDNKTINYSYAQVTGIVNYPTVQITFLATNFALQTVTYPDSTSTTYQYGNTAFPFALTGEVDERGIQIDSWTWTTDGRVQQNVQAGNVGTYTFTYDDADSQTTVVNPLGKNAIYHYNATVLPSLMNQIEGVPSAHCLGANTTYQYDNNSNVIQVTDGEGRVTTYTRESRGLPTSITRGYGTPSAATTTIAWNPTWRVPNEIVEPGRTTDYVWNTAGQLTSITQTDTTSQTVPYPTNGQTRTWTYGYTGLNLASVTGPVSGATTVYSYDANGFLNAVTNALNQTTTINSVNGRGQPTSITDPRGVQTALAYDLRGRLTSVSVDTGNTPATTTIAYTAAGDVASITDPIGGTQTFTYDNARRLTSVTNSAGETVTYVRDAMGNASSVTITNASSATTYAKTQTFDELGRLIQSVGAMPANSSYQFGYDRTDNLITVTDPRSYVFSYGFDALNRLIQETDEQSAIVTLTRNGVDAITAYQDPRTITTTYVRNGFGEIIQEASPDKGTTVYVRDANGNVTQRTDPRGAVPSLSDLPITDSRIFDTKGNITSYSRTVSPAPVFTSTYAYDAAGNITAMTYPSGRLVNFQRDTLGRITSITTSQTVTAPSQTIASSIGWVPYSGIAGLTFGNGVVQSFARDTDNRITGVVASAPSSATVLNRSLAWTGETLDQITDNQFPG